MRGALQVTYGRPTRVREYAIGVINVLGISHGRIYVQLRPVFLRCNKGERSTLRGSKPSITRYSKGGVHITSYVVVIVFVKTTSRRCDPPVAIKDICSVNVPNTYSCVLSIKIRSDTLHRCKVMQAFLPNSRETITARRRFAIPIPNAAFNARGVVMLACTVRIQPLGPGKFTIRAASSASGLFEVPSSAVTLSVRLRCASNTLAKVLLLTQCA